ncbi:MAG: 5,6-dimethylbenzimidazole synthase [Nitrospirae bacterium]|nr:5,6-dimethylbenzimidazole synthase [Nitrospirota bacterium]
MEEKRDIPKDCAQGGFIDIFKEGGHDALTQEHVKRGLYGAIFSRRDVRGQFTKELVGEDVIARVLLAAHHAPSVGFMQPWNFIVIRSEELRKAIKESFTRANDAACTMFHPDKRGLYANLKLEGIMESPLNICVTCDKTRFGPVVIGRTSNPAMDEYSVVCAVENLWLAARSEGLGVGWVSILDNMDLKSILALPDSVEPIAYLCIGHVSGFFPNPELEIVGWLKRLELDGLVYTEKWGNGCEQAWPELYQQIRKGMQRVSSPAPTTEVR